MTAILDIAPCSLVEVERRFIGACCLHLQGDEGSKHLLNVGLLLRDDTAQCHRRLSSTVTIWFKLALKF
jgi:hypothetical protein